MIKTYNQFITESVDNFSIYDFLEWTKHNSWNKSIDKSKLIQYTERFIGSGQWNIIDNYFSRLFKTLENVDIDYINDRLEDVFEEYPLHDMKYVIRSVAYGDVSKFDQSSNSRYNGMMSVKDTSEINKLNIIVNFLNKLLHECLIMIDLTDTKKTRVTPDELYVTSDEWSLKNFKDQKLEIMNDQEVTQSWGYKKFLKLKEGFTIERCLDMFRPAIYISIGSYKFMASKISHNKIRSQLEDILPSFLHDVEYDEIMWSMKAPQENESDIEIYDYDLKILLKML